MRLLLALVAPLTAVAALTSCAWRSKRERALAAEVRALAESVRVLSSRVEAAEADVALAVTQAEIAESLLVEKGVADEEEVEAMRRRFVEDDAAPAPAFVPGRDGELH